MLSRLVGQRRLVKGGNFGRGSLEHLRRWLGAQWLGLTPGVPSRPEPPGAPRGGRGAELGHYGMTVFSRRIVREDAQPVAAAVVRLVVGEPQQRRALRADLVAAWLELRGAAHLWLWKEPKAIVRRAGGDVGGDVVVRVDEPVRGGRLVDGEPRLHDQRQGSEVGDI